MDLQAWLSSNVSSRKIHNKHQQKDAGLELNVTKTSNLAKGVTQQVAFDSAHKIINTSPTLTHLSDDVVLDSFCPGGFVGIGVFIDTET